MTSLRKNTAIPKIDEKGSSISQNPKFFRKKDENTQENIQVKTTLASEDDFCKQLLILGYVQSYVDFYNLSHRPDPHAGEGSNTPIKMSIADMNLLQQNLISAEVSRRQGNTNGVYAAYKRLADFYAKNLDWKTAIYFHEKCLEISQLTSDIRAEMSANHEIGNVYQKTKEYQIARKYHERHEELAYSVQVLEEVSRANTELSRVYFVLAQDFDNDNKYDEALDLYRKCLEAAKKCWDKGIEGEANGKIGSLLLQRGLADESLPYLIQQSQISADMGFAEGRCRACSSLALAYDMLNKHEKALGELTLVHTISEQAGDMMLQAQACKSLGTLYSKLGKLEEAVEALQKHFTLVKNILQKKSKDKDAATAEGPKLTSKDLDIARVYVGISKGNLMMGAYVNKIQTDMQALLDWKLSRAEL